MLMREFVFLSDIISFQRQAMVLCSICDKDCDVTILALIMYLYYLMSLGKKLEELLI